MPSLSQILSEHPPLLLIDAASERVQAGLLGGGEGPRWSARRGEAGVCLFECLDELAVDFGSVAAFAFCEGPGSILGIRSSAMALRVWDALGQRPLFAYVGLAVVARAVGRPEVSGELMTPEGFRHWEALPPGTATAPYDLATLFSSPAVADADLFRETRDPDAFLHQEPSYAKWVPQIHRAP